MFGLNIINFVKFYRLLGGFFLFSEYTQALVQTKSVLAPVGEVLISTGLTSIQFCWIVSGILTIGSPRK